MKPSTEGIAGSKLQFGWPAWFAPTGELVTVVEFDSGTESDVKVVWSTYNKPTFVSSYQLQGIL